MQLLQLISRSKPWVWLAKTERDVQARHVLCEDTLALPQLDELPFTPNVDANQRVSLLFLFSKVWPSPGAFRMYKTVIYRVFEDVGHPNCDSSDEAFAQFLVSLVLCTLMGGYRHVAARFRPPPPVLHMWSDLWKDVADGNPKDAMVILHTIFSRCPSIILWSIREYMVFRFRGLSTLCMHFRFDWEEWSDLVISACNFIRDVTGRMFSTTEVSDNPMEVWEALTKWCQSTAVRELNSPSSPSKRGKSKGKGKRKGRRKSKGKGKGKRRRRSGEKRQSKYEAPKRHKAFTGDVTSAAIAAGSIDDLALVQGGTSDHEAVAAIAATGVVQLSHPLPLPPPPPPSPPSRPPTAAVAAVAAVASSSSSSSSSGRSSSKDMEEEVHLPLVDSRKHRPSATLDPEESETNAKVITLDTNFLALESQMAFFHQQNLEISVTREDRVMFKFIHSYGKRCGLPIEEVKSLIGDMQVPNPDDLVIVPDRGLPKCVVRTVRKCIASMNVRDEIALYDCIRPLLASLGVKQEAMQLLEQMDEHQYGSRGNKTKAVFYRMIERLKQVCPFTFCLMFTFHAEFEHLELMRVQLLSVDERQTILDAIARYQSNVCMRSIQEIYAMDDTPIFQQQKQTLERLCEDAPIVSGLAELKICRACQTPLNSIREKPDGEKTGKKAGVSLRGFSNAAVNCFTGELTCNGWDQQGIDACSSVNSIQTFDLTKVRVTLRDAVITVCSNCACITRVDGEHGQATMNGAGFVCYRCMDEYCTAHRSRYVQRLSQGVSSSSATIPASSSSSTSSSSVAAAAAAASSGSSGSSNSMEVARPNLNYACLGGTISICSAVKRMQGNIFPWTHAYRFCLPNSPAGESDVFHLCKQHKKAVERDPAMLECPSREAFLERLKVQADQMRQEYINNQLPRWNRAARVSRRATRRRK